ncbi:hypothetical protein NPIL_34071 [Nephila pilipes]|uniref:Uncharacterized protein n=1 Tax=Nephila pilipes TaxID=299642 RepID=A0A8X6P2T3_NEPPI|nr:hypothetical protein NPIL_34071 [Nephila pilipes]
MGHSRNLVILRYGFGLVIDILTGFIIGYNVLSKHCYEYIITIRCLEEDSAILSICFYQKTEKTERTRRGGEREREQMLSNKQAKHLLSSIGSVGGAVIK